MTRRPVLAGLAAGLMMTGAAALAAPASAEDRATGPTVRTAPSPTVDGGRLPFQREVAEIFPDATGGDRAGRLGRGIAGPSDGTAGPYDEPCLGERSVVRADTARTAAYLPGPEADPRPVRPVVQVRLFSSPAAARAALGEVRAVVRRCAGETAQTRTETYTWFRRSVPQLGEDRLGWSLRSDFATTGVTQDLHQLVLRGNTLVHVITTRKGELPDQGRSGSLAALALDTL